ncbi:4Fe-4S dicluster domain-containing protein [candidate division GN15 bacterium]|nr:4Fe-4S dicluster domain-containing protein [candidate division GN15 bacterium]
MGVIKDLKNLIAGLGITGKHLGTHAITVQYPEQRDKIPERSRGIVVLLSDKETGELNCTACQLCMRACPTGAIVVEFERDENKRKVLTNFTLDNTICCFCGLCEESCNFSALKLAQKYEFSTIGKEELVWDMHKLQEVGRDVPYEDKRKKKKAAPKKPTPKPTEKKPEEEKKPQQTKEEVEAQAEKKAKPVDKPVDKMEPKPEPEKEKPATEDNQPGEKPKAGEEPTEQTGGKTEQAGDDSKDDTKKEGSD